MDERKCTLCNPVRCGKKPLPGQQGSYSIEASLPRLERNNGDCSIFLHGGNTTHYPGPSLRKYYSNVWIRENITLFICSFSSTCDKYTSLPENPFIMKELSEQHLHLFTGHICTLYGYIASFKSKE
jgi:hypothetical protein